jgi:ABC-type branched-subunit amino acid transport system ATPase component
MNILQIHKLRKTFGGLRAVDDVNIEVRSGSIRALIGPNGSGKTTIFNLISGVLNPTSGSIVFDGKEITRDKAYRICKLGVGRTFQTTQLFGDMTIIDNLMLARHSLTRAEFLATAFKLPLFRREEREGLAKCEAIADFLEISALDLKVPAASLPYGLQRIIEIARALASEPKVILVDEPAAGLNAAETKTLSRLLFKIRESGVTIFLIEHDMNLVMSIADEITVLNYGRVISEGKPREIQSNSEVIKAYLGE